MEIWKDINGFEGIYQASSVGNIRSLDRSVRFGNQSYIKQGRILKFNIHKKGYLYVHVGKKRTVHRLIAETFIPNPLNFEEINHINAIKTDNRIENLEWIDRSGNNMHSIQTVGRKYKAHRILTNEQVEEIKKSNNLKKHLCHKYNISRSTVYLIQRSVRN